MRIVLELEICLPWNMLLGDHDSSTMAVMVLLIWYLCIPGGAQTFHDTC